MKPALLILSALLLAALAALALRELLPGAAARGAAESGAAASPTSRTDAALESGAPRVGAESAAAGPGSARASIPAAELAPAAAPRSPDRDRELSGVVLDERGEPVPAALVTALFREGDGYSLLSRAEEVGERTMGEARTRADGSFALELEVGRPHRLRVEAEGFATALLAGLHAGERVEVRLARGAVVLGRVTRVAEGAPVAGARVRLESRVERTEALPRLLLAEAACGADGRFRIEGVSPGPAYLEVVAEDCIGSEWTELEVPPAGELERNVVFAPCRRVTGRVTDAVSGAPVARARVGPGYGHSAPAIAGEDGEFAVLLLSGSYLELVCTAPGYGREERWVQGRPGEPDLETVDFALVPARRAVGVVVDQEGTPVAGAFVAACASDYEGEDPDQRTDFVGGRTGEDGRFELGGLHAGMRHVLFVRREGSGTSVFDFPAREQESAVVDLGRIALSPGAIVRGRVVDRRGAPLAGRDVVLLGWNADRTAVAGERVPSSIYVEWYVAERAARTDDLGRFAFAEVPAGTMTVRAMRTLRTYAEAEVVTSAGADVRVPDLVLDGGLVIEGRLHASDGGPLPTVYLSIDPEEGDAEGDDVELPQDGAFSVSNLAPGRWSLSFYPYASDEDEAAGRRFVWHTVRGVEAGTAGLEITLPREARVAGIVVAPGGAPARGAVVTALDEGGYVAGRAEADGEGRFELRVGAGLRFDLAAQPASDGEDAELPAAQIRGVEPGGPDVVLELP